MLPTRVDIWIVNNLDVDYTPGSPIEQGETMAAETIQSEITGSVWKIQAKPGDKLEADDTIMVLESMKMEIPVLAPDGGRIVKILVAEGDSVKEGQDLAIVET
jgi:acetyl-CoA carboxylase biotin carboxyl carrier protein